MAEDVETGGLMKFRYDKDKISKLKPEYKKGIEEAYERYYERKRRERGRKFLFIILLIIILVGGLLAIILS